MDPGADIMTLADLAEREIDGGLDTAATPDEIEDLRHYLADGLGRLTADWDDRPDAPLRVTKRRLRTMAICPAQILTEADDNTVELNQNLAAGIIADLAAGVLSVNPRFPADGGWYRALAPAVAAERPEVVDFVEALDPDDRADFMLLIDERCAKLPDLLGDLSGHRPSGHERVTVRFVDANVWLTAEIDLAVGRPRVLAEVKVGTYNNWIPEELRHYGLLVALRDRRSPRIGAAVTLSDRRVSAVSLGRDELELAARRVLTATEALVDVDRAVSEGRPVTTNPGDHCAWCRRVNVCEDAGDLARAGAGG